MRTTTPVSSLVLLATALLVLIGLAAASSSHGEHNPRARSGDGEWVAYGRNDNRQAYCDANYPGTLCAEWCEGTTLQPTGTMCCIDSEALGYPGRQTDCEHYIP